MGAPSSFSITTLDDNGAPTQPTLVLAQRALPYPGFELEGSMRAEFTWYPGNAVATVQMLGAQEKASVIKGMWKDRFIKSITDFNFAVSPTGIALFNDQQVFDTLDLVSKVEQIRLSGRLLEVKWDSIVRHGILTRFRQNWLRIEDLEWEMEFQWTSRGEPQSPPSLPSFPDPSSFAQNLQGLIDNIAAAIQPPLTFQVIEKFAAGISAAISVIDDAGAEMQSAVQNATRLVNQVVDAGERALAAAQSIQDAAGSIVALVEGTPPHQLIKTTDPGSLLFSDVLLADDYARTIKEQAQALQVFIAAEGDTLRASLRETTLLAAFTTRAPLDLRDVSQKYYGTSDHWRDLLDYNDLESSRLNIGTYVLVPALTTFSSSGGGG